MRNLKSLRDQKEAQVRKKALAEKFLKPKSRPAILARKPDDRKPATSSENPPKTPRNPLATVGLAGVAFYDRENSVVSLLPEPWLKQLTNLML